jgi:plastocyanin
MRHAKILLVGGLLATSLLVGCSGDNNSPTGPGTGGGTGGGTATQAPSTASVTLGDIFFQSDNNGTSNPAVDTVAVNGTVTWTWDPSVTMEHSVQSIGNPAFTSSPIMSGGGTTHQAAFTTAGTYQYDCAVHGQLMTGMIVVVGTGDSVSPPSTDTMASPPTGY